MSILTGGILRGFGGTVAGGGVETVYVDRPVERIVYVERPPTVVVTPGTSPLTDVQAAFASRWSAANVLTGAFPGGLHSGRLHAQRGGPTVPLPYAVLSARRGKPPEYQAPVQSGSRFVYHADVEISAFAVGKEAAGDLGGLVTAAFGYQTFGVPNSALLWCVPDDDASNEPERDPVRAEDVYVSRVEFRVAVERAVP